VPKTRKPTKPTRIPGTKVRTLPIVPAVEKSGLSLVARRLQDSSRVKAVLIVRISKELHGRMG
jgi:hypothetical protein